MTYVQCNITGLFIALALLLYKKETCGNYLTGQSCPDAPLGLEALWLGLTHTHWHTGQRVMARALVLMASSVCARWHTSEHAPTESI